MALLIVDKAGIVGTQYCSFRFAARASAGTIVTRDPTITPAVAQDILSPGQM